MDRIWVDQKGIPKGTMPAVWRLNDFDSGSPYCIGVLQVSDVCSISLFRFSIVKF